MKTERRHELHHNALADWLGDQIDRIRPYSRIFLGVLLAAVTVGLLYTYLSKQSARQIEQGWQRYFTAIDQLQQKRDVDDLTQLAESSEFANTPVGYWSMLSLADYHLNQGLDQLFKDRPAAAASLRQAIDGYSRVTNQTQYPMLAERAVLGIARGYESLNELDKARAVYEQLATRASAGPFVTEAQQRLRDLGQEPTKRFYDWFFAATPPRTGLDGPGMPGVRPNFGGLPDEGAFKSPDIDIDGLLSKPAGGAQTPAEGDQPSADAESDKPAADAATDPAAETPAADPAGDKSAGAEPSDAAAPSTPQP
ncbi:MAG TPA: hypothetical protein VGG64_01360 [Pirellulales bacterium]|jgi:hypothetical protein